MKASFRARALGVFAAYLGLGVFTLRPDLFGLALELHTTVWLSSGVGLAGVLHFGVGIWPAVAMAEFVITLVAGGSVPVALGTALGNTLEVVLAGWLLRSAGIRPELRRGTDVAALVVLAAGAAGALGAAVSTAAVVLFGGVPAGRYLPVWVAWWLTHANGMILGAPLFLATRKRHWDRAGTVEIAVVVGLLGFLGFEIFVGPAGLGPGGPTLLYLPFPVLIWGAVRFGVNGAATGNLVLSMIAVVATATGEGPFNHPDLSSTARILDLWAYVSVNAITALLVAGIVDERRAAVAEVRGGQERLRAVLEATADAMVAVSSEGRLAFANGRFVDLWTGGGNDEPPPERVDPRDARTLRLLGMGDWPLAELVGSRDLLQDEVRLDDGRVLERVSAPMLQQDRVTGRIWSFRDLSERTRLEQRVQQSRRLESLGLLAGGVAHDFNNLLVAILGNADLAESSLPEESRARRHVEEVIRASQRAADLCQQMLAYAGKGRLHVTPVDLNEVVEEMTELMAVALGPSIEVRLELDRSIPAVRGDVVQLRQVVLNLLTNAADALEGEGLITLITAHLPPEQEVGSAGGEVVVDHLPEAPGGGIVIFSVEDTGRGMDDETRERIFDPFFSTKAHGRGLGLAAVMGIVGGHRGSLRLRSAAGMGTQFTLFFPALPRTVRPAPRHAEAGIADPRNGELEATVLVVDDEAGVRAVAASMLTDAGARVVEAANGVEALELLADGLEAELVLLDLSMPGMDGMETARRIRASRPGLPIILSTGHGDPALVHEGGDAEVVLLRKPYRQTLLVSRVAEVLRRRGREDASGPAVPSPEPGSSLARDPSG